ncbi:MAG: hypothetical protein J2O39_04590, partial [Acidimicrobiales bacterium]|nr:hypothetical protein [Acidimicrobiales bacterium]
MAVVCANCGAESSSGFFCANCGARLGDAGGSPTGSDPYEAGAPDRPSFEAPSYVAPSPLAEEADAGLDVEEAEEGRGRPALVAAAVLDLVAGALLFAWFVAGGLYGAGRGAGFGFNFGHEFNVAQTDNFGFGSIGLFAVAVLCVVAGILCLERSPRVHQLGRGLTVAMGTFGLAT